MEQLLGSLAITTAVPATTLQRDDGFWFVQLSGPAVLTNVGGSALLVSVSATAQEQGQLIATVTENVTLRPGQQWIVPPPPPGGPWLLVSVPRQTARLWGWGLLALLGGTVVTSAYGSYALVRDLRKRYRAHHHAAGH